MCSNFRVILFWGILIWPLAQLLAQNSDNTEARNGLYGLIKIGYVQPYAFGNNALAEGYDFQGGYFMDHRIYFPKHFYIGLQGSTFKGTVSNSMKVGTIDKSAISNAYLQGGYSFLPRSENFGIDVGLGLGYAIYKHTKSELGGGSTFKDDGFSLMGNVTGNYRFSKLLGAYMGAQVNHDFLNVDSAPEVAGFFKNANIAYFTMGIQLHINQ